MSRIHRHERSPLRPLAAVLVTGALLAAPVAAQDGAKAEAFQNESGSIRLSLTERLIGFDDPEMATKELIFSPNQINMA